MAASSTRSKPAAKKTASKTASKTVAKKVSKVAAKPAAKAVAKATPKAASKKVAAKAVTKTTSKAVSKPEAKPEAKARAKASAKASSRKVNVPSIDDNLETELDTPEPTPAPARHNPGPELPQDLSDFQSQSDPEPDPEPSSPRRKSVLEVAEEDDEFDSEPPLPTVDDIHGLLDRLRKVAQFGGDALEELPRLIEQLEQLDDPAVMPRLLGLLEDNDPYGIYWNVLYVLEKFDDAYLRALLDGIEALYARAPQWAYTCVIRILNTRGDEDDCTAAFERLVNDSPQTTRTLVLQILRELAADPDTDADQKQNIARTITAVGGAAAAE